MYIAVGSTNQVKVNAVKLAISHQWEDATVEGYETVSGVGEQPRTDHETYIGSINRAKSAFEAMRLKYGNNAEILGVGLEGGVDESEDGLLNVVWCSVVDSDGKVYSSSGARFILDDEIASRILGGEEMGPIMDSLLNEKDTKKKGGMIGVVTKNFYNRTEEYASIARLTIGLWYGKDWRDSLS
jgi:inosine/xanthosine triphosphatase